MNAPTAAPPVSTDAPPADATRLRAEFPALAQEVNGHPLVYLDNAASTQKPAAVIEAVDRYYRRDNANVHRGLHELSNRATEAYEEARRRVAAFLGASDPAELVWTRGTTEAVNLVAWAWGTANLREGDEILLTVMEHHSNLVPWQLLAARTGARVRWLDVDAEGRLDLGELDEKLTERTRLVAVCHVSNALGTVNPVARIAGAARAVGARVLVDGAQSAPHLPLDLPSLGCDWFAFSGHKMMGPMGIGGLWGRREALEETPPFHGGGDMIDVVEMEGSTWAPLPHKLEAGTPNVAGAVGLAAACGWMEAAGREALHAHESELTAYALEALREVPGIRVFGPSDPAERAAVVSFTLGDVHPHDLATILDAEGIAIRAGHHCTQPLMRRLEVGATARASFAPYNTTEDVDRLVHGLHRARTLFGH